ncbi:transposase [Echinicola strongylocentroti]|uniref:Transposase n=1 Tax=Echinicola strongylocentroti TaxID=1795355 RepID=A0A2Z4IKK3_9BACT|nr:transposase [Echinicola strongylocentroti]AWW31239.1 transposase [Echinicola strongylocentroti]
MNNSVKPYSISDQHGVYFLTLTVVDWLDVFTRKEYKLEVVDSLNYCVGKKGLELYAWCLMSNHLHLLARAREPFRISDFLRDFKKYVAARILDSLGRESIESRRSWILSRMKFRGGQVKRVLNYKFWEDNNRAIWIESNSFLIQKLHYIHENPVKAMIVESPEDYLFSSARDYAGMKGLVKVALI